MRYRFVQDDDCHWYSIPANRYKDFQEWLLNFPIYDLMSREELKNQGIRFSSNEFDEYRIDGVEQYSFESPKNEVE